MKNELDANAPLRQYIPFVIVHCFIALTGAPAAVGFTCSGLPEQHFYRIVYVFCIFVFCIFTWLRLRGIMPFV